MRTRQWLTGLLGGWLAAVGGLAAQAQSPPFQQYGPGNPDAVGMLPPPYNSNYAAMPQSYTGLDAAGYPADANAWPNISPYYGPAVDETSYQNGFWFNRQLTGNREYYLNVEGLLSRTGGPPHTLVGDRFANAVPYSRYPGITFIDHNQRFFETAINVADNQANRIVSGATGGAAQNDIRIFVEQNLGILANTLEAGGARATWGWFNPDYSGFQVSGFWQDRARSGVFIGDPRVFDEDLFGVTGELETLRAYAGIPLGGADTDGDFLPGVVQPFDIYYRMQFESQIEGGNLDWYTSPVYERSNLMVRPAFGARVFKLKERFTFTGADSGMGYTIQGPLAQVGQGQAGVPVRAPLTLEPGFSTPDVMESAVTSWNNSMLAGPEAGLRFDLGGQRLKIWATSKVGLLANHSVRKLHGFNIGDALYVPAGSLTTPMPRDRADLTQFGEEDSTTFLSPLFEQSIFVKAPVFQYLPYLNKARILQNAEFQMGYTVIVIGQVYRPSDTINWQAFPVNPSLSDKRSTYYTGNLSLGLEWAY